MKKLSLVMVLVIGMFLMSSMALADEVVTEENTIAKFIKERIVKTGISYDIVAQETRTTIGAILVDGFYLDALDLDLFIDGDKSIIVGLDYMFKKGKDLQPYLGLGIGLDRIEKVDTFDEWGEYFATINAGVRFKF